MTLEQIQKLSDEELNRKISGLLGRDNLWVLKKRGVYYRPKAKGYCTDIRDAWVVSEQEANHHVYPHDEPVTKHPAPIPNYCNDLNACAEMEETIPDTFLRYEGNLERAVRSAWLKSSSEEPFPNSFPIHARARHRAEAFLFTKLNSI